METIITGIILASGIGVTVFGRWLELRPRQGFRVALFPPFAISLLGVLMVLFSGAHMISLMGLNKP
jgi:hypothetical protein